MKSRVINILKFILSSIIFFYMGFLVRSSLSYYFPAFLIDVDHINNLTKSVFLEDTITFICCFVIFFPIIKDGYIKIKNKEKGGSLIPYLKMVVKYSVILFCVKIFLAIISGYLSAMFNVPMETSNNQSLFEILLKTSPILMTISGAVLAPLSEEIIFRGALGKILDKKGIFVAVSGLIFGLMHITDNKFILGSIFLIGLVLEMIQESKYDKKALLSVISVALSLSMVISVIVIFKIDMGTINPVELLNSISYIGMGAYLATIYKMEDNILVNVGVHAMQNLISLIAVMVVF